MSRLKAASLQDGTSVLSRKRKSVSQDIEIDVVAPEPPSRKAARKAKRAKSEPGTSATNEDGRDGDSIRRKDNAINGRSPYGVWIGNLSFSTTKQELQAFISGDDEHPIAQAQIVRIHLPLSTPNERPRSQNKGFAYVDFSTSLAQQNALQLSEKLLAGRRVLIKSSRDFDGRPEKTGSNDIGSGIAPGKRVFVGNLDFDMTKEDLESHFKVCGPITGVRIATFEDSGKCKGYAWIDFEDIASAAAAVRGWVESATTIEANEPTKAPKRRLWVNKIKGRKLRAEFGEDKTTRYNKRFGKRAGGAADARDREEAPDSTQTSNEMHALQSEHSMTRKISRSGRSSRYDQETLTKLTGAIVGAEGKKTTFE